MEDSTAKSSNPVSERSKQTTSSKSGMNDRTTSETVPVVPLKASVAGSAKSDSPNKKSSLPPTVITVDTSKGDDKQSQASSSRRHHDSHFSGEAEGRTPKHANKASTTEQRIEPEKNDSESKRQGAFFPPRPFEGRMGGGPTGAFQPHTRSHQQGQSGHVQVSPQTGRYYTNYQVGPYQQGPYERNMHDYTHRMPYGQQQHQYPGMFPPPYQQQGAFNPQQQHHWSQPPPPPPPPPQFHGRPPPYPPQHGMLMNQYQPQGPHGPPQQHPPQHQQHPGGGPITSGDGAFSRAVSSSFDRSVKSRNSDEKITGSHPMEQEAQVHFNSSMMNADGGSVSDDGSWKQLNQIQSVDEEEIRKRIADKGDVTGERKQSNVKQANSNSSSLTNSPTDGVEKKAMLPGPPKMTSSLDSLASVSSAQAPLKTPQEDKIMSPAEQSLDLMKCSSGSSALLLPPQHSGHPSIQGTSGEAKVDGKQACGESLKEAMETGQKDESTKRPAKKVRMGSSYEKKSPLSIACSPSVDPHDDSKDKARSETPPYSSKDSFYDKPLAYSYSLESMNARNDFPAMMARPQSSASSTGTPMQVVPAVGERNAPSRQGVTQLPSWEINAQDSFGGHSAGNPLAPAFSFSHDYAGPTPTAASDLPPHAHPHVPRYADRPIESRNQSFDNGHYHGSFSRAETMSFESRGQASAPEQRQGYQGHFPPHAPSWGSAGSYSHPSGYPVPPPPPPQFRMTMQPMIMRSFSQESDPHRINAFQPPSEFQAPPTNINRNRPRKETHIMTTPFEPSKTGVFGWTKEEDMRLTEIMKKYKNPRDWEPIAKELDRNRSAKECHERWIRYLKPGVRKGQWTDQEDEIVMEAVTSSKEQPFTRWSDLAQRLPGRVGKQIRDRWVNHLNPNINHLPFSKEDDLLLWEGHQKVGKRWVEIATKFFKGSRSENHIKNRWYSASFKKFISNEFGASAYNSKGGGSRSPKKDSKKKQGKRDADDDSTFSVGV